MRELVKNIAPRPKPTTLEIWLLHGGMARDAEYNIAVNIGVNIAMNIAGNDARNNAVIEVPLGSHVRGYPSLAHDSVCPFIGRNISRY